MKKILLILFSGLLFCNVTHAQQVPRQVVVEHFTNTYCSVCANRNPGFYNNLKNFPAVMHVAYHPSAPYEACPLNQQNKSENDARTNYYGVYGGTPRLVLQGNVIPANNDYGDAAMFNNVTGETSSFLVNTNLVQVGNELEVNVVLKKVDTSSVAALNIYALIAEDTLHFNANNGETLHQDVFRKSFAGSAPIAINVPANIGDSTIYTKRIAIQSAWNLQQLYAAAIVSKADKTVEQAGRSEKMIMNTTGNQSIPDVKAFQIYPNPAKDKLYLSGDLKEPLQVEIYSTDGRKLKSLMVGNLIGSLPLDGLAPGTYILKLGNKKCSQVSKFVCE